MHCTQAGFIHIPAGAENILQTLHRAGFEAYVVGGCVRDSLLHRVPDDWDITTSARPEEVKSLFRRTVDTGIQHGTVTVLMGREGYEVTTYRVDGEYADGRHPVAVTFTPSLQEDLKRRDFTINAMAYNPGEGLVDRFGGMEDLQNGIIRAVGDPVQRFTEDALRMLRAVRFSAQLGYEIETETQEGIRGLCANLRLVSAERVRVELEKLLCSPHPGRLREMYRLGILDYVLPELSACMDCEQNNPHHCRTVGEHIIRSVEAVRNDRVLRLTMLLHDIAKPAVRSTDAGGTDHFHGHVRKSADMADGILRRLKYDNDTRKAVVKLVAWHDRDLGESPAKLRRNLSELGAGYFPLLMEVKRADLAAQSDYLKKEKLAQTEQWMQHFEQIIREKDALTVSELAVNGKDLIAQGVRPGVELGETLHAMLEDVLEHPEHNTRGYLLEHCGCLSACRNATETPVS